MKIEIDGFYGEADYRLLSEFFGKLAEERRLREKNADAALGAIAPADAQKMVDAAASDTLKAAEEAPKRRGRPKKEEKAAEPETPAAEPAAEEAEVVEEPTESPFDEDAPEAPATRDDVKKALTEYQGKFGAAEAVANFSGLTGYAKFSAIPDDPAIYQAVIDKVAEAIEVGKPGGVGG